MSMAPGRDIEPWGRVANEKELWHTLGATEEGVGVAVVGVDEIRDVD